MELGSPFNTPPLPRRVFSKNDLAWAESTPNLSRSVKRGSTAHLRGSFLDLELGRNERLSIAESGAATPLIGSTLKGENKDDYEERYKLNSPSYFEKQPKYLRQIFEFPSHDIRVITASKMHHTSWGIRGDLPPEETAFLHPYLVDALNFFQSPWILVEFTNRKYSPLLPIPPEPDIYEEDVNPSNALKAFKKSESMKNIADPNKTSLEKLSKLKDQPMGTTKACKSKYLHQTTFSLIYIVNTLGQNSL